MKQLLSFLVFLCAISSVAQSGADEIVRKAIESKSKNDPREKFSTFRFNAYNKLVITANPDSIAGRIDSIFIAKRTPRPIFV
ncbi:MAG: hypothetical protein EOP06_22420, partial [Proteobacteria bacterium]